MNQIAGATGYNWTLPNGWTGTSNNNSINITAGSVGGNIAVTASFACGTSLPQTLSVAVQNTPVLTGSITGNNSVCDGSVSNYSISLISGASNYIWNAPNDWSYTGNTNSVNMNVGSTSGSVTIAVENGCGISNTLTLNINVLTVPTQPSQISGSTTLCGGSNNNYSIASVSTASSYTWTLPSDWTGTSNSNSINALAGSTSGNISVTANNTCGSSIPQTLTVTTNNAPAIPSIINGSTTICENTTETYSVNPDPNANTYQWTIPNGWTGTSTSDLISITTNTLGGVISVSATNGCGTSAFQTLNIFVTNVPPTLDPIIGSTALCAGTTTYAVPIMAGAASYEWNLPIGWTGTSTTNSIDVTTSAGTGTIQVSAVNGCGNSVPQTLAVTINAVPNVILDLTSIAIQCSSETAVALVGGTPVGGVYAGSSVGGGIFNPSLAGVGNHIIQYSFVDANACSAFAYDTIMVDVCIGVDEIANTSVKAYPNPGNGLINIVVDGKLNLIPCEIYNAAGMSVKSFILSNTNNIIDLSEFANGLYLVKMQIDGKLETMRYIKN